MEGKIDGKENENKEEKEVMEEGREEKIGIKKEISALERN